ncbi:hypothetical protein CPB83DRAFT_900260 [Crepidotus variabilis]|uniref:Uncharacterized protein n=1 Tax=Crepidotus variabilis TaxID=179855 RepID=A0A9P6E3H3_9AGAR|nr:hypothetical protein CPB83DRAFT_900260 [Crepidotus variabilis]
MSLSDENNLAHFLHRYRHHCGYCAAQGEDHEPHEITKCSRLFNKPIFFQWKRGLIYPHGTSLRACWFCHIPTTTSLHPQFSVVGMCPLKDVVVPMMYAILTNDVLRERAQARFPQMPSLPNATNWLVQDSGNGFSNMVMACMWFGDNFS